METIEEMYEKFKTYKLDIEGRSENSVNLYIIIIKDFCSKMNITSFNDFVGVKAQTIRDWLSIIAREQHNGESTRNNKLSAIKEIYKFLDYQEHFDIDRDISRISFAKVPYRESKCPTKEEMEMLLYAATNKKVKCIISIISKTGMRWSEVLQITCSDIENGYAYIIGKGNKERKISFPQSCIQECQKYINRDRKKIIEINNIDSDLLFVNASGGLYTLQSFNESLKYYANKIGLDWANEMSAHKLRHGFITSKLREGKKSIDTISRAVGHSNISVTNNYLHTTAKEIEELFTEE